METHYSILDCDENSSFDEIKKKYQELALKYHPDKAIISCEQDREKFVLINKAWNVLREPDSRLKYDANLKYVDSINQPLIYETIEINKLQYNEDSCSYTYRCRCGGTFTIEKSDLATTSEYLIECDDCSFNLLIKN